MFNYYIFCNCFFCNENTAILLIDDIVYRYSIAFQCFKLLILKLDEIWTSLDKSEISSQRLASEAIVFTVKYVHGYVLRYWATTNGPRPSWMSAGHPSRIKAAVHRRYRLLLSRVRRRLFYSMYRWRRNDIMQINPNASTWINVIANDIFMIFLLYYFTHLFCISSKNGVIFYIRYIIM